MLMAEHSICQPGRPCPKGLPTRARRVSIPSRGEIEGVPLPFIDLDTRPGHHFVGRPARQRPIPLVLAHGEVDAAVDLIGEALLTSSPIKEVISPICSVALGS